MPPAPPRSPSFVELFTPKLVTVLREGYGLSELRRDAVAGLTVAIVAIPLSMAIAIASGTSPDRGLYTAIIGGFLVSALGGSRFQIGGPAGAFIVLIATIVERHGYHGLVLATLMAGVLMMAIGFLRLGTYIKFIPHPVIVGFTAGIATIIFASQLKDLLGLPLDREPAALLPKLQAIGGMLGSTDVPTVLLAGAAILAIVLLRILRPHWPGLLIVVAGAAAITAFAGLGVATIGSRFGAVPSTLPAPALPEFSLDLALAVLPDAFAIALLGSIESLLSALVADGMTGRRHRSNCELVAQGCANIGSVMFGGICVTGTIARTATNVRSGACGPVAGIFHALYILVFMFAAAPLIALVPLAALAAVLAVVAWNMAERHEVLTLIRASAGDRIVLLATFFLTVFADLTTAIAVGVALAALLFMHRMAQAVDIQTHAHTVLDSADDMSARSDPLASLAADPDVVVYRIRGPFFFGAAATAGAVLDRLGEHPKRFVIDFAGVPFIDSSGAATLASFVRKLERSGTAVTFSSVSDPVRASLETYRLGAGRVRFAPSVEEAVAGA